MKKEAIKTGVIALLILTNMLCLWKICGNLKNAISINEDCPTYPKSCDNDSRINLKGRLGGGFPLDINSAQDSLTEFKNRINALNECAVKNGCTEVKFPAGCWISKLAIDNLFDRDINANGLYCYFIFRKSNDSVSIEISPYRSEYFIIQQPTSKQKFFMSETLCPEECGPISK